MEVYATNKHGRKAYRDGEGNILIECSLCRQVQPKNEFGGSKGKFLDVVSQCRVCRTKRKKDMGTHKKYNDDYKEKNPLRFSAYRLNRRARKYNLPALLTSEDIERLGNVCLLTGTPQAHMDHVIPLACGYGGSTIGNMMPLSKELNQSKKDYNVFVWARVMHKELGFTMERFNEVMTEIAARNDMTLEEYRHYVYWCHDIERCVSDEPYKREVTLC